MAEVEEEEGPKGRRMHPGEKRYRAVVVLEVTLDEKVSRGKARGKASLLPLSEDGHLSHPQDETQSSPSFEESASQDPVATVMMRKMIARMKPSLLRRERSFADRT